MRLCAATALVIAAALSAPCFGQATIPQPFNGQLRTDPSVGNVQGIQRYGRPLKCDPDEGTGYSYHVYPVADYPQNSLSDALTAASQLAFRNDAARQIQGAGTAQAVPFNAAGPVQQAAMQNSSQEEFQDPADANARTTAEFNARVAAEDARALMFRAAAGFGPGFAPFGPMPLGPFSPYPPPFDATAGLRNFSPPLAAPEALRDPAAFDAVMNARAMGFDPTQLGQLIELYHQPLIQVKVRVVEVIREDGMRANSILEYVSRAGEPSLTSGFPANVDDNGNGEENVRGISTFPIRGLVTAPDMGSGILFNLTTEHINWALQLLASEFNADVITAPEVVTLNGQNVEFLSGSKVPFQLGQNVIQGTNNNIQQFFYKNIGTFVSVTPKIVNWGWYGEGRGEAAIVDSEIKDWNALAEWMLDTSHIDAGELRDQLQLYSTNQRPVPFALKSDMLKKLNLYTRSDIVGQRIPAAVAMGTSEDITFELDDAYAGPDGQSAPCPCPPNITGAGNWEVDPSVFTWFSPDEEWVDHCRQCDWKPEDCTIDMAIIVRLSDVADETIELTTGNNDDVLVIDVNKEENVRAVANVIQIKSGHGVVMAGLIGEREEEAVAKVPVVGDIPWVGALFRSKETIRQKTEVLVFVEARVLDPRPEVARAESYQNFRLGQPYVDGEFLDNPLECGMYRVGFGTYLPPIRCGEQCYWTRHHRKVRKICTHFDDFKE